MVSTSGAKTASEDFRQGRDHQRRHPVTEPNRTLIYLFHAHERTLYRKPNQPVFIEPMQVVPVAELPDGGAWGYEAKLDGPLLCGQAWEWLRPLVTQREWIYQCERLALKPARIISGSSGSYHSSGDGRSAIDGRTAFLPTACNVSRKLIDIM
jgi:hypothetical protein